MSILIKNGQIVLNDKIISSDILIEGDKIKKIAPSIDTKAAKTIDAKGKTIMPGFVDMHCHLREPGLEYKEDISSGTKSAAAGGFTSICCMPNTDPVLDNAALINYIKYKAREVSKVKVFPIGAITKGLKGQELAEMGKMKQVGAIAVSDDGRPVDSASLLKNALEYAKGHDILTICHSEDSTLAHGGFVSEGKNATIAGLKAIPKSAEDIAVARDCLLALETGARVHIAHVSTKTSVDLIRFIKSKGALVTAEACPHHFAATDKEILSYNTSAKINPPLRTDEDAAAIIDGLVDGTIDAIATDHAPHGFDEKRQEFGYAPFGTIGFESAFSIGYTYLVKSKKMTLSHLVKLMSTNPAKILKLKCEGIKEGGVADLTIADLNKDYKIDQSKFLTKARNCLFDGWAVSGKIECTISDGEIVFDKF